MVAEREKSEQIRKIGFRNGRGRVGSQVPIFSERVNLITQIKLKCENTNAVAGATVTGN